ncbi:MAG TPA: right-handed parallel beta-helix repeat-containing protein [Allosphingosinicella sp.]|nr:right-handed parallel beta-helix repeat-containing protein [Allosphingosinicella sp.]
MEMTQQQHIGGFWSYVHHDDEHESGRIARLRERLERSIRFFSGNREFRIFLDRKDIGWGQKWAERLASSINDALLLFPMITPSYFASAPCREEALAFRDRQTSLNRDDLILPIYYLTAAHLENAEHGTPDEVEVATLLRAHQYEDWRALRDTPESDPVYAKAIERLAQKAVEALNRASPPRAEAGAPPVLSPKFASPGKAGRSGGDAPASAESAQAMETVGDPEGRAEPGLIITFKVNPMPGRAQFTTISEAITRAPGGARILIAAGHYRENLVIDKPLELIGDGPCEDIIVEGEGPDTIVFDTNIGVVRNLTIRLTQKKAEDYCVWVQQGRLELEDCDLSSTGLASLAVMNNADPRVRRNRIHHGSQVGILVHNNGRGTYEENEIYGNAFAGIEVQSGADPILRRNRIYDGKASAILVNSQGRGMYEDNEIFGNTYSGIEVRTEAEPIVRRNRIHDGMQSGIYIHDLGRGTFEDNQINGNRMSGIFVASAGNPTFRRNAIFANSPSGIRIKEGGSGIFEDNELSDNGEAWDIDPLAEAQVKRSGNRET